MEAATHRDAHAITLTIPAKPEFITLGRLALTGLARTRRRAAVAGGDRRSEARADRGVHQLGAPRVRGRRGPRRDLYELHPDRLVVEVSDRGGGFAPRAPARSARGEDDELAEGGLGIAIIEALADELEIGEVAGGGSRLRFVKRFA